MSSDEVAPGENPVVSAKESTDVVGITIKFAKKIAIITAIYLVGYVGWSVAWLYCFAIVLALTNQLSEEKRHKWDLSRAMALGYEKEIVLTKLHHLPSWVHFPDIERVEWLNRIIKQTWTRVNHYTRDLVPELIEPVVQSHIKMFKFNEVVLGHVPFRIDGIKVYDEDLSRNKIVMDLDISYAGDCRITFQIAGMTGGIEDFQLRGRLRVVMKPLISTIPIIGGLQVYFTNEPEIDFDLVGVAQILAMPGLRTILQKAVLEAIDSMLLFPNVYPIKLSHEVDNSELKIFEPEGVLRVHMIEAKHLMKKDIGLMGNGKSDPYAILTVGPKQFRTQTIDNTVDPKWDYWCEFQVELNSELRIHVWDQDEGSKDETLGSAVTNLAKVAKNGQADLWIPLQDVMHGMIHVRLTWLSLSQDSTDLDAILKETLMIGSNTRFLHSAVLILYVDSAKNLQQVKPSSFPDPYAVIKVEKTTEQTNTVMQTCHPVWEKGFTFMLVNPTTAILTMMIYDKKSNNEIGQMSYDINKIMDSPNLEIKGRPFVLTKSGQEATVTCSLKLRILKRQITEEENGETFPVGETNDEESEFLQRSPPIRPQNSVKSLKSQNSVESSKPRDSVKSSKPRDSVKSVNNGDSVKPKNQVETETNQIKEDNVSLGSTGTTASPRNSTISTGAGYSPSGSIMLTLRYSTMRQKLAVVVHEVVNIPVKDPAHLPDLYVKLYLLPGKKHDTKRKTQVVRHTINPVFDETFEYLISAPDLNTSKLQVTVAVEKKVFNRNSNMGQVIIDLSQHNLTPNLPHNAWFELQAKNKR